MKLDDKLQIIDRWLTYRRRVYALPGHFNISDNGIYEIMTPIGDAKGIPEVFNIRLEGLCDNELQKTVDKIKHSYPDGDYHIQWPYGCSDRVHVAIRGEVPKYPMDDFVFGIMKPEDMPCYPPLPDFINIKSVVDKEDFNLWCDPLFQEFWFFDKDKHYHLIEEGKIICFIAYMDGKHIANNMLTVNNNEAALDSYKILPEYRNKGIEAALCQHTIQYAFNNGAKCVVGYGFPEFYPDEYRIFTELGFPVVSTN